MRILNINDIEKDKISNGNLTLLKEKLGEAEALWFERLLKEQKDHRFTQGVYSLLSDVIEVLS